MLNLYTKTALFFNVIAVVKWLTAYGLNANTKYKPTYVIKNKNNNIRYKIRSFFKI